MCKGGRDFFEAIYMTDKSGWILRNKARPLWTLHKIDVRAEGWENRKYWIHFSYVFPGNQRQDNWTTPEQVIFYSKFSKHPPQRENAFCLELFLIYCWTVSKASGEEGAIWAKGKCVLGGRGRKHSTYVKDLPRQATYTNSTVLGRWSLRLNSRELVKLKKQEDHNT